MQPLTQKGTLDIVATLWHSQQWQFCCNNMAATMEKIEKALQVSKIVKKNQKNLLLRFKKNDF